MTTPNAHVMRRGEFHSRGGFCFQRLDDGSVVVRLVLWAHPPEYPEATTVREVVLPENEWASVMAAVCARGETGETWQEAHDFHKAKSVAPKEDGS